MSIAHKASKSPYRHESPISTGLPSLDWAIGIGGIPRGRISEIVGDKSTGKTTLAMTMIATAQKKGLKCVFADVENALNFKKAESLGVDLENLTVMHGSYGEEYLNEIEDMIRNEKVDLIIVDSVDALSPKEEIESKVGDRIIGAKARMIGTFCRKVIEPLRKNNVALVLLNQTRVNIMQGFEYTPGGKALEFYKSLQIKLRPVVQLKQGERIVGIKIKAKITKNKLGDPFGEIETNLLFASGFNAAADLIDTALKAEVITKQGNTLYFGKIKLGVGAPKARAYLEANPEIAAAVKARL
jgi:recombination protein RecA